MGNEGRIEALPHVVVVGGGIAGLAAAFTLKHAPVRVTLLEAEPTVGGKVTVSDVAGVAVDEGAEAIYARRAKTTGLIAEAGLGEQITRAGAMAMATWSRREWRALPGRLFMGVPCDLDELKASDILSGEGMARARSEERRPSYDEGDVSVAEFIGGRMGQEVVDRLVDPFISGVYSGPADQLSFGATLTPLVTASRKFPSLVEAAAAVMPTPRSGDEPGIATIKGGLGTLPQVLADALLRDSSGARVRTRTSATGLARTENRYQLTVHSSGRDEILDASAVVLALPAGPAGRLLGGLPNAAAAAKDLSEIPYADVATVTLAYPLGSMPPDVLRFAGYRVPAADGFAINSVIFTTAKWPHLAGEVEIVKCSIGRHGQEDLLQRDDDELKSLAMAEVAAATGLIGAPLAVRVRRWDQAVPQYTVGHLARVARVRSFIAAFPGLAACGAIYDGVGVGMCMTTGRRAAQQVLEAIGAGSGTHSSAG